MRARRAGAGYRLPDDRLNNYRYWCCTAENCNNPAADTAGLPVPRGVDGFSFSQDPAWSSSSRCEQAVATAGIAAAPADGYNPAFALAAGEVGACLPTARMGGASAIDRWAGGARDTRWAAFCIAADLGGGYVGQVSAKHYMYRSADCDWRDAEEVAAYRSLDVCAQVPATVNGSVRAASRWSYTACDAPGVCPRPPSDGLVVTRVDPASCAPVEVNGRPDYVLAVGAAQVGVCLARAAVRRSEEGRAGEGGQSDGRNPRSFCSSVCLFVRSLFRLARWLSASAAAAAGVGERDGGRAHLRRAGAGRGLGQALLHRNRRLPLPLRGRRLRAAGAADGPGLPAAGRLVRGGGCGRLGGAGRRANTVAAGGGQAAGGVLGG
eukprot:SAG22_NODE_4508_length_1248_cov_1.974761_1_plen_378_part_10